MITYQYELVIHKKVVRHFVDKLSDHQLDALLQLYKTTDEEVVKITYQGPVDDDQG